MRTVRPAAIAVGGVAVAIALVGLGFSRVSADPAVGPRSTAARSAQVRVTDHGALPDAVRESSGVAVSRAHAGIFWTHNDSGDEPRLYALDASAALVGTVELVGARARDWEDIDIGPCPSGVEGPWCVYVADTGDNARRRARVRVYVVPEPQPDAVSAEVALELSFSYEAGPADVEALAVTPGGDLVLTTKGRDPPIRVFVLGADRVAEAAAARPTGTEEPTVLGSPVRLPIRPDMLSGRWVTGGTMSPDGTLLALRTYTEVYFFAWPMAAEPVEAAPTCALGLREPGGEAIGFSADGRLYLTSESPGGRKGHLLEIGCPGVTR